MTSWTEGSNMPTGLPKAEDVTDKIRMPVAERGAQDVNEPSSAYKKLNERWIMTRALMEGTDALREKGQVFLPKEIAETNQAYENRLIRSVLFAAYKKTVTISTGRPFSRPITFDKFSPRLEALNENIDLQGNNIHVFSRHVFLSGLAHGHSFIFIDHTKRPDIAGEANGLPSLEVERDANLRPFWRKLNAYDVIGWRSIIVGGVEIPTQVRIRETSTKPNGMFGERSVNRVRVLEPGAYRVYEEDDSGKWITHDEGEFIKANGERMDRIPIVPFYSTLPESFYNTTPTLLDLAFMNVLHWQSSSDQQHILHVARVPILFGSGFHDNEDFEIGSGNWIKAPEGALLKYVEHSGTAIKAGEDSLEDLENQMRIMGAEVLVRDPARITATQKILDSDEATSELQDMVSRYEDFLQSCYAVTADWIGEPVESAIGAIDIFKDFGIGAQAFQEANVLLQARLSRQITQERYLIEIQRRGLLGDDVDVEFEVEMTRGESGNEEEWEKMSMK